MLASRATTCPRDHPWRKTMAPSLSRPTTWKKFLPMSMPITAIVGTDYRWRGRSTAGPSHYRTSQILPLSLNVGRPANAGKLKNCVPLAQTLMPASAGGSTPPVRWRHELGDALDVQQVVIANVIGGGIAAKGAAAESERWD